MYFLPVFVCLSTVLGESVCASVCSLSLSLFCSFLFPSVSISPKGLYANVLICSGRETETNKRYGIENSLAAVRCFRSPNVDCATVQSSQGLCHLPPPSSKGPPRFGVFETGQLELCITGPSLGTKRSSLLGYSVLLLAKKIFFFSNDSAFECEGEEPQPDRLALKADGFDCHKTL